MAELFLSLSASDRRDALGVAADRSGRPAHLLEKDIWVVWALQTVFGSALEALVRMVAPMMPHLAEECWATLGGKDLVANLPWDRVDPNGCSVAIGHPFGATGAHVRSQGVKEL